VAAPYNLGDICRHEAAALFSLQELIDKNMLGSSNAAYNQLHTVAKMKHIDLKTIRMLSSPEIYESAELILETRKATVLVAANERVEAEVEVDGEFFPVVIQKNDERNFDTSCKCNEALIPCACTRP
jgi:non-specific serine/threonine protein kinase